MKKVLMALTNVDRYGGTDRETGIWLEEATSFYDVLTKAGWHVDFASANGGAVPVDPHSRQADPETMRIFHLPDFQDRALSNSMKFTDVRPEEYAALYFAGGHGAMWDFPDNQALIRIAETIYKNGGFLTSVCHGEVGFLNLKDENGEPLIRGRKINGFTDKEEEMNGTAGAVPMAAETELSKRGCEFVKGAPFTEFAVRDGRFITGQNPMSSYKVANLLVDALKEIPV